MPSDVFQAGLARVYRTAPGAMVRQMRRVVGAGIDDVDEAGSGPVEMLAPSNRSTVLDTNDHVIKCQAPNPNLSEHGHGGGGGGGDGAVLSAPVIGAMLGVGIVGFVQSWASRADAAWSVGFAALAAYAGYQLQATNSRQALALHTAAVS